MRSAVVLAYHAVGTCAREDDPHNLFVTPDTFERHMSFLADHRRVVPLEDALEEERPGCVAITFDDAYRCVFELALPILERHAFPSTVFVPTGSLGGRNSWDEPSRCDLSIVSSDELAAMAAGGVAIESHGHSHIDMATAPVAEVARDLAASRDRIEEVAGRAPLFLAYPFGRSSVHSRAAVEAAGFRAAFTIDRRGEGRFAAERVPVNEMDGARLYGLKTSGRYLKLRHSKLVSGVYRAVKPLARRVMTRS